jgi:hypothetical protein
MKCGQATPDDCFNLVQFVVLDVCAGAEYSSVFHTTEWFHKGKSLHFFCLPSGQFANFWKDEQDSAGMPFTNN